MDMRSERRHGTDLTTPAPGMIGDHVGYYHRLFVLKHPLRLARISPPGFVLKHSGGTGVAQLVARSTPDRCVVGSSPTCGTEHFGFPPSAPRLGNQRPW